MRICEEFFLHLYSKHKVGMEMLLMVKVVLQVILMFVAWRFIIKLGDWTEDILSTLRDILEELKKGTDKKETEKKILKD